MNRKNKQCYLSWLFQKVLKKIGPKPKLKTDNNIWGMTCQCDSSSWICNGPDSKGSLHWFGFEDYPFDLPMSHLHRDMSNVRYSSTPCGIEIITNLVSIDTPCN